MIFSEVINVRDAIARLEAQQKNIWHDAGISLQIAMERGDDTPLNETALDDLLHSLHCTSSTKSCQ
jgi:hypothetical protein